MIYSLRNAIAVAQLMMGILLVSHIEASPPGLLRTTIGSIRVSSSLGREPKRSFHFYENALLVRGGEIELSTDDDAGFLLTKLRNFVRGILKISDTKAPVLSSILRAVLKTVESITGVKILSVKKEKKDTKKKKKKSTKSDTSDVESIDSVAEEKSQDSKKKSLKKPSATTQKHLSTNIKNTNPNYRIQRELKEFIKSPPPNLSVQVGSNMRVWIITMIGAKNTIYEGEVFKLRVSFPPQYPTVPPSVYFLQGYIPIHEHVYTNGDICLSLLGKDWRPTMTAQSIAVSILSILSSAQSKSLPMDNARHAGNKPGEYQKDWVYHDDNC
jgi:ubiquitin-conjugating enzyme E2 W